MFEITGTYRQNLSWPCTLLVTPTNYNLAFISAVAVRTNPIRTGYHVAGKYTLNLQSKRITITACEGGVDEGAPLWHATCYWMAYWISVAYMLPDNYSRGGLCFLCILLVVLVWVITSLHGRFPNFQLKQNLGGRPPPHPPASSVSSYTYVEYQEMLFRSGLLSSYVCNLHMSS